MNRRAFLGSLAGGVGASVGLKGKKLTKHLPKELRMINGGVIKFIQVNDPFIAWEGFELPPKIWELCQ